MNVWTFNWYQKHTYPPPMVKSMAARFEQKNSLQNVITTKPTQVIYLLNVFNAPTFSRYVHVRGGGVRGRSGLVTRTSWGIGRACSAIGHQLGAGGERWDVPRGRWGSRIRGRSGLVTRTSWGIGRACSAIGHQLGAGGEVPRGRWGSAPGMVCVAGRLDLA